LEDAVSELDEAWAIGLAAAESRARAAGRADISAYLALRSSNDLIRKIATDWLLGIFATAAGEANRAGAPIQISTEAAHRFKVDHSTMVGSRLSLANGVRLLSVEAGWPRTPRDGFIRGGGLAFGNIKHRGINSANEALRLVLGADGTPIWILEDRKRAINDPNQEQQALHESHGLHEVDVKKHVALLLNASQTRPTSS
jgi:hypothetical protein